MFKLVNFDTNSYADSTCKQLFKDDGNGQRKHKPKGGKVSKKRLKISTDEESLKEEVRRILGNDFESFTTKQSKTKQKRKKLSQNTEEEVNKVNKTEEKVTEKMQVQQDLKKDKKKEKLKKLKEKSLEKPQSANVESLGRKKKEKIKQQLVKDLAEPQTDLKKKKRKKKRNKTDNGPNKLEQESANEVNQQETSNKPKSKQKYKNLPLRERMMQRLQAARFRYLNEQIYSVDSKEADKIFKEDPDSFNAYHEGYRQQVNKWPLNPLDVIIKNIQRMPKDLTVADFGCGEAKLAKSVPQKVHSFDLVAVSDAVTACDMAHVPLPANSVDIAVFCLSLMGTNLHDYLLEANRVLKVGGLLKIAEVESRFDDVNQFIEALKRFNFTNTWKDLSHNLFYFLDFKKETNIKNKKKLPTVALHPCLYKKR